MYNHIYICILTKSSNLYLHICIYIYLCFIYIWFYIHTWVSRFKQTKSIREESYTQVATAEPGKPWLCRHWIRLQNVCDRQWWGGSSSTLRSFRCCSLLIFKFAWEERVPSKATDYSSLRRLALFKRFEIAIGCVFPLFDTLKYTYSDIIFWVVCPIQSPPNPYCRWFNPHFRSMFPIHSQYQNTRCAWNWLRQQRSWHRYGGPT